MLAAMDNMYSPSGSTPPDPWSTQPLGSAGSHGDATAGQREPRAAAPGRGATGRAMRWGIGIAAVALLLGGGTAAGLALTGSSSAAPATAMPGQAADSGPAAPAGPTGQAAVLNTLLSSAGSSSAAFTSTALAAPQAHRVAGTLAARCRRGVARLRSAGRPAAAGAVRRACARGLRRLHRLGRRLALTGIHGEFTFETADGARTIAFERGTVQSASATGLVVRAKDGTTQTWVLGSQTVLRQDGRRVQPSMLAVGQLVFAGGPVTGGTDNARLVVIAPAAAGPS
jgi:hypothetical protein